MQRRAAAARGHEGPEQVRPELHRRHVRRHRAEVLRGVRRRGWGLMVVVVVAVAVAVAATPTPVVVADPPEVVLLVVAVGIAAFAAFAAALLGLAVLGGGRGGEEARVAAEDAGEDGAQAAGALRGREAAAEDDPREVEVEARDDGDGEVGHGEARRNDGPRARAHEEVELVPRAHPIIYWLLLLVVVVVVVVVVLELNQSVSQ